MRWSFTVLGLCIVLAGCAAPPYQGLNKQSYGDLANYRDSVTNASISPPHCDPTYQYADVNELSRQITGLITKPFGGMETIDPAVHKEDLDNNFKIPGDMGMPTVVLLERTPGEIVFWYNGELVTLAEAAKAAEVYCGRDGKQAAYEGSSRKCSAPQLMPVAINGKSTMITTYVISAFQCVMPPAAHPTKSRVRKGG